MADGPPLPPDTCPPPAAAGTVRILPAEPSRLKHFDRINRAWIAEMFTVEPVDDRVLRNPEAEILAPGGDILFAATDELGIVGTGALRWLNDDVLELTKMGVDDAARGLGIGRVLLSALIDRAAGLGPRDLVLLTSSKCRSAIHLYEAAGFVHDRAVMEMFGRSYSRCDVAMRYTGFGPEGRTS